MAALIPCFRGCGAVLPAAEAGYVESAWTAHCGLFPPPQPRGPPVGLPRGPVGLAALAVPDEVAGAVSLCTRCHIPHSAAFGAVDAMAAIALRAPAEFAAGPVSRTVVAACCVFAAWKALCLHATLRTVAADDWVVGQGIKPGDLLEAEPRLLAICGYGVKPPPPWRVIAAVLDTRIGALAAIDAFDCRLSAEECPGAGSPQPRRAICDTVFEMEYADELDDDPAATAAAATAALRWRPRASQRPLELCAAALRQLDGCAGGGGGAGSNREAPAPSPAPTPAAPLDRETRRLRAALRTFYQRCGALVDVALVALCAEIAGGRGGTPADSASSSPSAAGTSAGPVPPRAAPPLSAVAAAGFAFFGSPLWPLAALHLAGVCSPLGLVQLLGGGGGGPALPAAADGGPERPPPAPLRFGIEHLGDTTRALAVVTGLITAPSVSRKRRRL